MQNKNNSKNQLKSPPAKIRNERHVAISVLQEINQQGAYNNIALRRALDAQTEWQPHQRAFVTELVNGTLRNRILIDHIIDSYSKNPSSGMKPFIKELLRTAVYQIVWLDKVPPSAAVNEAVKLARACGFSPLSGFVNGILRNIVRGYEGNTLPFPQPVSDPTGRKMRPVANDLSLRYSFPLWLSKAIIDWLGDDAEAFCAQSHVAPAVTICVNPIKTTRDALADALEASGIECTKSTITDACLPLKRTADLTATSAYKQGHFFVIDEAAYLAAKALSAQPNQKIIDLCAAPGGKSFVCAGMMQNSGEIISCDIHPHKIRLMSDMASRLGINCITVEERDATVINPNWIGYADAVLLDAPCSGLGIIRKRPDIKYTKTVEDVRNLAAFQRTLLTTAAEYVKPGGILVYSTCTITREENEDNVRWFLDNFPYKLDGDALTLLPKDGHDGFFIARMVRLDG